MEPGLVETISVPDGTDPYLFMVGQDVGRLLARKLSQRPNGANHLVVKISGHATLKGLIVEVKFE